MPKSKINYTSGKLGLIGVGTNGSGEGKRRGSSEEYMIKVLYMHV
jgi:hypothetical protein